VAEAEEHLVPPEVDPEQREPEHRELRVPVRPGDEARKPRALLDELLQRQLVEPMREVRLDVEDAQAVRERLLGVPVGDPAGKLVDGEEAEPDRDLTPEIRPATRQI